MPVYDGRGTYQFQQSVTADIAVSVPPNSITAVELAPDSVGPSEIAAGAVNVDEVNAAVAGNGLVGGAGAPLDVNVDGTTLIIVGDTAQVNLIENTNLGPTFTSGTAPVDNSGLTPDETLDPYTADDQSAPYSGIDNAQAGTVYAQLSDLESLRVAYENLRAVTEDLAEFNLHLIGLLQANNLIP